MTAGKFRVATICGSMRFYDRMIKVAERFTAAGAVVLMPFVAVATDDQDGEHKAMLDRMHRQKIDMADLVLIVCDRETHYIGESTKAEMEYTHSIGKPYQWIFEGPA